MNMQDIFSAVSVIPFKEKTHSPKQALLMIWSTNCIFSEQQGKLQNIKKTLIRTASGRTSKVSKWISKESVVLKLVKLTCDTLYRFWHFLEWWVFLWAQCPIWITSGVSLSHFFCPSFSLFALHLHSVDTDMHYSSICPLCHCRAELWADGCKAELQSINQGLAFSTMGYADWVSHNLCVLGCSVFTKIWIFFCTSNSWSLLVFDPWVNDIPKPNARCGRFPKNLWTKINVVFIWIP